MLFSGGLPATREVGIRIAEVLRYLGYKAGKHRLSGRIRQMLEEELEDARELITPRGYFGILEAAPLHREKLFRDAEKVAFGVCTIGDALEKRVEKLFEQGEAVRGLILDAIGSAAAEEAAEMLNREILQWSRQQRLRATRRFSPGYGHWPVGGQDLIFGLLTEAPDRTGVALTPAKMMIPRKSVSFAIKLGRGRLEEIDKGSCRSCALFGRCSFQIQEGVCARKPGGED